jgi:hypothetical protein
MVLQGYSAWLKIFNRALLDDIRRRNMPKENVSKFGERKETALSANKTVWM